MKSMFATVLAAALLFAGAAQAKDRVCRGDAETEGGQSVAVDFTMAPDGSVKSRRATWSVHAGTIEVSMVLIGMPGLDVEYDAPTEQGLGPASQLTVLILLFTSNDSLARGATVSLELPDGRRWAAPKPKVKGGDMGGLAMVSAASVFVAADYPELFADLELLGRARLALRQGQSTVIAGILDFSPRAERDALYRTAWAKAVEASANPQRCKRS